jgi:hypothetical protein
MTLRIIWALGLFVRPFTSLVDPGDIYPPQSRAGAGAGRAGGGRRARGGAGAGQAAASRAGAGAGGGDLGTAAAIW